MPSPINVAFWTTFYETEEDDDRLYHDALAESEDVVDRAAELWDWKDLGRGVDFAGVKPVLEETDLGTYLEQEPADAVEALGTRLVDGGAMSNATVVTPAFVLHLTDSNPSDYSLRFPIFDARVWTAFVFLAERRTGDESLPVAATTSATKYGEFVDFFRRTIPDEVDGRVYERALFRFGSYISGLPEDRIVDIRTHLESLEDAIEGYSDSSDQYIVSL